MKIVLKKYAVNYYTHVIKELPGELVNKKALRDMRIYNDYVDLRSVQKQPDYVMELSIKYSLSDIQIKRAIAKGRKHFKGSIIQKIKNAA